MLEEGEEEGIVLPRMVLEENLGGVYLLVAGSWVWNW